MLTGRLPAFLLHAAFTIKKEKYFSGFANRLLDSGVTDPGNETIEPADGEVGNDSETEEVDRVVHQADVRENDGIGEEINLQTKTRQFVTVLIVVMGLFLGLKMIFNELQEVSGFRAVVDMLGKQAQHKATPFKPQKPVSAGAGVIQRFTRTFTRE